MIKNYLFNIKKMNIILILKAFIIVHKEIIKDVSGWLAAFLSIFFYLSPIFLISSLLKGETSSKNLPIMLFITTLINCILWTNYGLILNRLQLYVTCGSGCLITLIWLTIYFIYFSRRKHLSPFFPCFCLLILSECLNYVCYYIINFEITGVIAVGMKIIMMASPFEKIIRVFKTGNYTLIPIFSSIGICGMSISWVVYSLCVNDKDLLIPNFAGVALGFFQIIIYMIFYCIKGNNKTTNENRKETNKIKEEDLEKNEYLREEEQEYTEENYIYDSSRVKIGDGDSTRLSGICLSTVEDSSYQEIQDD